MDEATSELRQQAQVFKKNAKKMRRKSATMMYVLAMVAVFTGVVIGGALIEIDSDQAEAAYAELESFDWEKLAGLAFRLVPFWFRAPPAAATKGGMWENYVVSSVVNSTVSSASEYAFSSGSYSNSSSAINENNDDEEDNENFDSLAKDDSAFSSGLDYDNEWFLGT